MAQCCASGIIWLNIVASSSIIWLNVVHPWLNAIRHQYVAQCCTSGINMALHHALINMAQCCASYINITQSQHHGSLMYIRHQYGSMLCIRCHCGCASCINIMARCCASYAHQASVWFLFNAVCQASVQLNAVYQASLWHNMAQCCAGINLLSDAVHQTSQYSSNLCIVCQKARCGASMTQAVNHASIWLNKS